MRPFDLEKAKAGEPVITRSRKPVRIISISKLGSHPVVALKKISANLENVILYKKTGAFISDEEAHSDDLFMAGLQKEAWINIYPDFMVNAHPTKEDADLCAEIDRVACIKIDWEE